MRWIHAVLVYHALINNFAQLTTTRLWSSGHSWRSAHSVGECWRSIPPDGRDLWCIRECLSHFVCLATNMQVLRHRNAETFIIFRNSTPLCMSIFDWASNRELPSVRSASILVAILACSIAYSLSDFLLRPRLHAAAWHWSSASTVFSSRAAWTRSKCRTTGRGFLPEFQELFFITCKTVYDGVWPAVHTRTNGIFLGLSCVARSVCRILLSRAGGNFRPPTLRCRATCASSSRSASSRDLESMRRPWDCNVDPLARVWVHAQAGAFTECVRRIRRAIITSQYANP